MANGSNPNKSNKGKNMATKTGKAVPTVQTTVRDADGVAVSTSKPQKNRAEGLKIIDRLEIDPNKVKFNPKLQGRSTPVADDKVAQLADSIRRDGQLQAVQVRRIAGTDEFEAVFGFTRSRAGQMIVNGYNDIDGKPVEGKPDWKLRVEVVDITDEEAFRRNVVENNDRFQCTPYDTALNHQKLRDEFQMSDAMITRLYGYSHQATVTRLKKVLQNCSETVKQRLHEGLLPQTGAFLLAEAELSHEDQDKVLLAATDAAGSKAETIPVGEIQSAIKAIRKAQKEATTPTGSADGTTPQGEGTQPAATPDGTSNPDTTNGTTPTQAEKTFALTVKQFKDEVGKIASHPKCPDPINQLCVGMLDFITGKSNAKSFVQVMMAACKCEPVDMESVPQVDTPAPAAE